MLKNTISHKKLAVVVGSGTLPFEVIKGIKKLQIEHVIVKFEGVEYNSYEGSNIIEASFENIADLFQQLQKEDFNSIVCCGYIARPSLKLSEIKFKSRKILEPLLNSLQFGDESLFSTLLKIFKEYNLEPISLKELIPESFPRSEYLTNFKPDEIDLVNANRAERILRFMSEADLGQSVVVRDGLCVAVETALGTDKMLFLLQRNNELENTTNYAGVLFKAPKINQNQFLDLPVIGEDTVNAVKKAKLKGIVIKHSGVIVLKPKETIKLANRLGVFIWSKK